MPIFSSKNKKEKQESPKDRVSAVAEDKKPVPAVKKSEIPESSDLSGIILRPRITEKASLKMEGNAYVFEITDRANKGNVRVAFKEIYKVEPRKINIVKTAPKRVFIRGKRGVKPGKKKAYIYLKEGDKIDVV